jgi:hypothetical protein
VILKETSPLLRLPNGLSAALVQLLDGVRYGIEMADLSYERLKGTMLSLFAPVSERPPSHVLATTAFLDAWSMINAMSRLRKLIPQAYDDARVPAQKVFLDETETLRQLRNSIEHADERILNAEPFAMPGTPPLWGTLECLAPGSSRRTARCASLTPGTRTFRWASSAVVDCPYPRPPVDHISITAFEVELSLTKMHEAVERLARGLEEVSPPIEPTFSFADSLMVFETPYDAPEDDDPGPTR